MATIQRRVTRSGHVRYRAQVRIKNQPEVPGEEGQGNVELLCEICP